MNLPTVDASPALDAATRKARARLLPFLVLMYVLAFVDRANVGFAKSVLQADTGLSDAALAATLGDEDAHKRAHGPASVAAALRDPRVLFFSAIYFAIQVSVYGVVFYLPTRIAGLTGGHVGTAVGFLTAIPWCAAIAGTFVVTRRADRSGRHRAWAAAMLALAAAGIAASALGTSLPVVLVAFCVAATGFVAVQPLFWTLPTGYLGGAAAAGGIAFINSVGNLGGFVAPNLKSVAERVAGHPQAGMLTLALFGCVGAVLLMRAGRRGDGLALRGEPGRS
ncbi:MFS transporter [Burkholderia ubonensis]|uniref:MFS transporter n=1 Tax=Burkholderia ubonensis TaxID=101571 RepID=UPI00075808B2|nr:MFS transporter [Burkholderia ubonensis]KVU97893.1 hypothetical protein WK77_28170 [Burkholderia ubonensis]KVZ36377.1 hypothetical protein WL16_05700 [Burkholderia ubonensis]